MNRDQELWGVTLWIEREHGDDGPACIADHVRRLALIGDVAGVAMWGAVAKQLPDVFHPFPACQQTAH